MVIKMSKICGIWRERCHHDIEKKIYFTLNETENLIRVDAVDDDGKFLKSVVAIYKDGAGLVRFWNSDGIGFKTDSLGRIELVNP